MFIIQTLFYFNINDAPFPYFSILGFFLYMFDCINKYMDIYNETYTNETPDSESMLVCYKCPILEYFFNRAAVENWPCIG